MKKLIATLLAAGLMSSAFAQSAPQPTDQTPPPPPVDSTASVPGAAAASDASLGELTPFYVVMGVAAVATIVIATSGGSSHSNTTGTH